MTGWVSSGASQQSFLGHALQRNHQCAYATVHSSLYTCRHSLRNPMYAYASLSACTDPQRIRHTSHEYCIYPKKTAYIPRGLHIHHEGCMHPSLLEASLRTKYLHSHVCALERFFAFYTRILCAPIKDALCSPNTNPRCNV